MDEGCNSEDDDRVLEWEIGLPTATDLTPLSHLLISPELASAFSITAEPFQTMLDVNRASQNTLSSLRKKSFGFSSNNFKVLSSFMEDRCSDRDPEPMVVDEEESDLGEKRKIQSVDCVEEADSGLRMEDLNEDCTARTLKRARLVWTPHLHKRFVDVVTHLGIDNVVPKTIVQLMNVEGLTRENVASHLQKYRLYLKRKHEGDSCNDQLFVSLKPQKELNESRNIPLLPMQHGAMPMVGGSHGNANMGVPVHNSASGAYNRYQIHPYSSMYREPHRQ